MKNSVPSSSLWEEARRRARRKEIFQWYTHAPSSHPPHSRGRRGTVLRIKEKIKSMKAIEYTL
jgi:hypothetical protein